MKNILKKLISTGLVFSLIFGGFITPTLAVKQKKYATEEERKKAHRDHLKRWRQSEQGKQYMINWRQSEKGQAAVKKYQNDPKKKKYLQEYWKSKKGQVISKRATIRTQINKTKLSLSDKQKSILRESISKC